MFYLLDIRSLKVIAPLKFVLAAANSVALNLFKQVKRYISLISC